MYVTEKMHQEMRRLSQELGKRITKQTTIVRNTKRDSVGWSPFEFCFSFSFSITDPMLRSTWTNCNWKASHRRQVKLATRITHRWQWNYDVAAREAAAEMTKIMESNYPESLRKIIIINGTRVARKKHRRDQSKSGHSTPLNAAPKIFTMVFALFKAFMSQLTIDKIQVYGTDDAWRSALLEEVDADQLPPLYGGTRRGNGGNPFYVDEVSRQFSWLEKDLRWNRRRFLPFFRRTVSSFRNQTPLIYSLLIKLSWRIDFQPGNMMRLVWIKSNESSLH